MTINIFNIDSKALRHYSLNHNILLKKMLFKSLFIMFPNTAINNAFSFILSKLAARFYCRDEVSLASVLVSAGAIIANLSSFGFPSSIVRFMPESTKRNRLFNSTLLISLAISFILGILFIAGSDSISPSLQLLDKPEEYRIYLFMATLADKWDQAWPSKATYSSYIYIEKNSVIAINANGDFIAIGEAGLDDAYVLNTAIERGGKIILASKTAFNATNSRISVPSNTGILGGIGTTLCGISLFINEKSHINIENLNFEGNPSYASIHIYGASSDIIIKNCIANSLGTAHYDAFLISTKAATITERIIFENCSVIDGARNGFICRGTDTYSSDTIQHVSYVRCKAIRCGKETQAQDWVIGFDPNENHPTIKYFIFQDCIADQCLESGFHQEDYSSVSPADHIRYIGCKSTRNGQKASVSWTLYSNYTIDNWVLHGSSVYKCKLSHTSADLNEPSIGANWSTYWTIGDIRGHGFFVSGNISLLNCSAEANYGYGIFINECGADAHIIGCDLIACNGGINMFQSNFNPVFGQIIGNKIISLGKGIVLYSNPTGNAYIDIIGNYIEVAGINECLYIAGVNYANIDSNYLKNINGTGYGIYIESGVGNSIINNVIEKAGSGINVNSQFNYISTNKVIETGWDQAISLNAPNNTVTFNDVPQIAGSAISGNTIFKNIGY